MLALTKKRWGGWEKLEVGGSGKEVGGSTFLKRGGGLGNFTGQDKKISSQKKLMTFFFAHPSKFLRKFPPRKADDLFFFFAHPSHFFGQNFLPKWTDDLLFFIYFFFAHSKKEVGGREKRWGVKFFLKRWGGCLPGWQTFEKYCNPKTQLVIFLRAFLESEIYRASRHVFFTNIP